ncbi:MAG TPA: tripartite tricarboxylate transporter substrate binding protein [Devosia sp.]|nr:tripartite tricarboxylate transporter substrate binding protein [Devosia sp.]
MTRRNFVKGAGVMALAVALSGSLAATLAEAAEWPERPIQLIVPWSAGGGTDATGRIVATLLQKELGQPVNVVNRTGGGGIVGHTEIANAKPDGYTIGVITTELSTYHWAGTSALTYKDYSPIGLYNTDATAIHVRSDGPATIQALIDQIKAEPGAHKASGANLGGFAHLGMVGLLTALDLPPTAAPWIPAEGAAPALQLLASKAIDIVSTTMPEVEAMTDTGMIKTLVILRNERDPAFPDVPSVKEALGVSWNLEAWRGIGGPKGMPDEVVAKLSAALDKVVKSEEFTSLMATRKFGVTYLAAPEFTDFLATMDAGFGTAMTAAGLVK